MKFLAKALMATATPVALSMAMPVPAHAQATSIAVANIEQAVRTCNAFKVAVDQIKVTYKAQIDAFETRSKALQAELQPLVTAFQAAQNVPNPNQQTLQTQFNQIQAKRDAAQKELSPLYAPVARAQAYAEEQIAMKLDAAIKSAMTKKRVGLVVAPGATVSYQPAADITNDIIAELNTAVPSVGIVPPANWQPGQAGQQAPAQPQNPQPQGR